MYILGFPGGTSGKEPTSQCRRHRDAGLIPGSGRSPGGGHSNPLQYSFLENPMDREAWWATVHGVTKSWTQLKQVSTTHYIYIPNRRPLNTSSTGLSESQPSLYPPVRDWSILRRQRERERKIKDQNVSSEIKSETFICFVLVGHNLEERLTHRR